MTVHEFTTDLAYSHAQEDSPWWDKVYRSAFGASLKSHTRHTADGWHQRAGIDRLLILQDSTVIRVDEKVRRKSYPDILLETESKYYGEGDRRNVQGWAIKHSASDYIAYAFEPTQVCYLLPFQLLRSTLRNNYSEWWDNADRRAHGFRWAMAKNPTYVTRSIAVPTELLMKSMSKSMCVRW